MQRTLLELQALDVRLDQLAHRRASVPEKPAVDELTAKRSELDAAIVAAGTEVSDLTRAQRKAEADVEQVRTRRARDEHRLQAGQVGSPKELENLQHEIEALTKRQSDLEDVELDVMERLETSTGKQTRLEADQAEVGQRLATAEQALAEVYAEIDGEAEKVRSERATREAALDEPLLTLYEKLRKQHGGIGAAQLHKGRCEGCRMELDVTFLNTVRHARADEVLRCEECGRILVRTPESGL